MSGISIANWIDRAKHSRIADCLAVAVAVSLPLSTSATSILVALWFLALVPTLSWAELRCELETPAGGLPVLLFLFGALGMLWADVALVERARGLEAFLKLLVIPLLLVQFRLSDRGLWVFYGYAIACLALFLLSTIFYFWPATVFLVTPAAAVPVKNAATQSGEFVICIFALLYMAIESFERQKWLWVLGLSAMALGMLTSILFVANGRTSLVVIPILLAVLAFKKLNTKGVLILFVAAILLGGLTWASSSYLRKQTAQIWTDYQSYEANNARNSSGERVEFYKKSIEFIREAPTFGHGTGTIHSLFIKATAGKTGAAGSATTNPHNQTFAVAIQLGIVGALVLWAMWIAHVLLFRGNGLAEWIGLVIVVQNIVGSIFNSHLFDFVQGWVYVVGVGVAGGLALKRRASAPHG